MKAAKAFIKFLFTYELIPYRNNQYLTKVLGFRANIASARRKDDWQRVAQYKLVFFGLLSVIAFHSIHLYATKLDEYDAHVQLDLLTWLHIRKELYVLMPAMTSLVMYFLYWMYFSPDIHYLKRWLQQLIIKQKCRVKYHWPYHYKHLCCSCLIRTYFWFLMSLAQLGTIVTGNLKSITRIISSNLLF